MKIDQKSTFSKLNKFQVYVIAGQPVSPTSDVIEVIDMEKLTLSVLKAPNGTNLAVATVTDVSLINACIVPLEDKSSVIVTGGFRYFPFNTSRYI
jgi:hypothetical protein